jgi:uncharacterized protein (TIGR02145 family)
LYEEGKNQIVQFEYVGGDLLIEWKYKYFHEEVLHKRRFKYLRNTNLPIQLKIADEIIQEMDTIIKRHKQTIIAKKNLDPGLVKELELLEKIEKTNFLKVVSKLPEYREFMDIRDGNSYKTIKIGNQIWMAENFRYILLESSHKLNEGFYVYDYNGDNLDEAISTKHYKDYGCLYNLKALRLACPIGWHIPTDHEWSLLIYNLGGSDIAVRKLISDIGWDNPQKIATNESGFSALPGGQRFFGKFTGLNSDGYWWSSTSPKGFKVATAGMFWHIDFIKYIVDSSLGLPSSTFYSIRCIKN